MANILTSYGLEVPRKFELLWGGADAPVVPPTQLGVPTVGQIHPLGWEILLADPLNTGGGGGAPAGTYAAEVIGDNAIAYWRMGDSNASGALLADELGTFPASIVGAVTKEQAGLVAGDANNSCLFAGGYAFAGNSESLRLQRLTCEAVIKLTAIPVAGSYASIIDLNATDMQTFRRGYQLFIDSLGNICFGVGLGNATWLIAAGGGSLVVGTVYHVAGTFDGINARVYLNGILIDVSPDTSLPISYQNATGLFLGIAPDGALTDKPFAGVIDEAAIYSYPLGDAAILRHKTKALG